MNPSTPPPPTGSPGPHPQSLASPIPTPTSGLTKGSTAVGWHKPLSLGGGVGVGHDVTRRVKG